MWPLSPHAVPQGAASAPSPTSPPIQKLPNEVLLMVFDHLEGASLVNAHAVCRRWAACDAGERRWRELFWQRYPRAVGDPPTKRLPPDVPSWRELYSRYVALDEAERAASELSDQVGYTRYDATRGHDFNYYGAQTFKAFGEGIRSFLKMGLAPLCFGGSALAAVGGVAVATLGTATGVAMVLGGIVIHPLAWPGAKLALGSLRGGYQLEQLACAGVSYGIDTVLSGICDTVGNNLYATGDALATLVSTPGYLWQLGITKPRLRATLRGLIEQQQRNAVRQHALQDKVDASEQAWKVSPAEQGS